LLETGIIKVADLYIREETHRAYLADGNSCYPLDQKSIVQNAGILLESGNVHPSNNDYKNQNISGAQIIFLELSFDPIARIKRGKFYQKAPEGQPATLYKNPKDDILSTIDIGWPRSTRAYKYQSCSLSNTILFKTTFVEFANQSFSTRWRILSVDATIGNDEVYVLHEVNSIGATPALDKKKIPQNYYGEIKNGYDNLLNELNSLPKSVVDLCRHVTVSILSSITKNPNGDSRLDLGDLIKLVNKDFKVIKSCAEVINRFHPRGKPNEQENHDLSEPTRLDSDFAVQCVFQIIRELKWEK